MVSESTADASPGAVGGRTSGGAGTGPPGASEIRSYASRRSPSIEKQACVSSYAVGTTSRLLSARVHTGWTGNSGGGVRSTFAGRVLGAGKGAGDDDCAQTTTQQDAVRANARLMLVVDTVIIGASVPDPLP